MIPVPQIDEPDGFDNEVRTPGTQWLVEHPDAKRPHSFWKKYLNELRTGFSSLCGYAAMLDPTGGTVDHYLSWNNHPNHAYEWSNYRFASGLMNNIKRTKDNAVLDPFVVGEGWFEILLPSLQMAVTKVVPQAHRAKAEFTLKQLKLRDDERVIRWRQAWYKLYLSGGLTLEGLRVVAPLIAAAIDKQPPAIKPPRKKKSSTG